MFMYGGSHPQQQQHHPFHHSHRIAPDHARKHFTDVRNAGSPSRSPGLPMPIIHRAVRDEVVFYDVENESFGKEEAVMRAPMVSGDGGGGGDGGSQLQLQPQLLQSQIQTQPRVCAYMLSPSSEKKKTQMGCIYISRVLEIPATTNNPRPQHHHQQQEQQQQRNYNNNMQSSSSSSASSSQQQQTQSQSQISRGRRTINEEDEDDDDYDDEVDEDSLSMAMASVRMDDSSRSSSSSSSSSSSAEGTSERLFRATNTWVSIKISCKRTIMQRWAEGQSRSENPWQEIGVAQFLGTDLPNLLGMIDAMEDDQYLYAIMDYCPNGDLYDMIEQGSPSHMNNNNLANVNVAGTESVSAVAMADGGAVGGRNVHRTDESIARHCFVQLLSGLHQLQRNGIFHRDLSIENVLVKADADDFYGRRCRWRCVIIDYGMAVRVPVDAHGARRLLLLDDGACGKVRYMAPEIFANRLIHRYAIDGFACDIWAAGVILFVLLTGKFPYGQPDLNDVGFCWVTNNVGGMMAEWNISLSPLVVDLLQKMFRVQPTHRLCLAEIMEHPWVQQT